MFLLAPNIDKPGLRVHNRDGGYSMTNPKPLQQLVLRQMLLEGSSSEPVTKAIRRFNKSKKAPNDHLTLVAEIRKEVANQSKAIMSDETISEFIDQTAPYINNESVLD